MLGMDGCRVGRCECRFMFCFGVVWLESGAGVSRFVGMLCGLGDDGGEVGFMAGKVPWVYGRDGDLEKRVSGDFAERCFAWFFHWGSASVGTCGGLDLRMGKFGLGLGLGSLGKPGAKVQACIHYMRGVMSCLQFFISISVFYLLLLC